MTHVISEIPQDGFHAQVNWVFQLWSPKIEIKCWLAAVSSYLPSHMIR